MTDIDLIPVDYRNWLQQRSMLRNYVFAFVLLNALVLGAGRYLAHAAGNNQSDIARLRAQNAITQQQQQQLEALKAQKAEYDRQWSLLRGLRASAALDEIFAIIDQSLVAGDLWFLDWNFRRAGIIVDGEQRGIETGYFIIVSQDEGGGPEPKFVVETQMSIQGQAKDHQALSRFVRALYGQDLIADVSVRRTSRTDFADGKVVDFDLTVVLNSAVKGS